MVYFIVYIMSVYIIIKLICNNVQCYKFYTNKSELKCQIYSHIMWIGLVWFSNIYFTGLISDKSELKHTDSSCAVVVAFNHFRDLWCRIIGMLLKYNKWRKQKWKDVMDVWLDALNTPRLWLNDALMGFYMYQIMFS